MSGTKTSSAAVPGAEPGARRDLAVAWAMAGVLVGALVGAPSVSGWQAETSPAIEALAGQVVLRGGAATEDQRHLPLSYDLADDDLAGTVVFAIEGQPGS